MLYIFDTELPKTKSVIFSMQKIFGIGLFKAKKICKLLGFSSNLKIIHLTELQSLNLVKTIEELKLVVSNDLKKQLILNNSKQLLIKSYKGLRKLQGLPVRGQRTHTNAKTARKL